MFSGIILQKLHDLPTLHLVLENFFVFLGKFIDCREVRSPNRFGIMTFFIIIIGIPLSSQFPFSFWSVQRRSSRKSKSGSDFDSSREFSDAPIGILYGPHQLVHKTEIHRWIGPIFFMTSPGKSRLLQLADDTTLQCPHCFWWERGFLDSSHCQVHEKFYGSESLREACDRIRHSLPIWVLGITSRFHWPSPRRSQGLAVRELSSTIASTYLQWRSSSRPSGSSGHRILIRRRTIVALRSLSQLRHVIQYIFSGGLGHGVMIVMSRGIS